jgi:periplasmic divalent cation tolerance protein
MAETDIRVLLVTAPPEAAASLADAVLEERLVACANLVPGLTSLFWWQGAKDEADETLVVFKTTRDRVDRATAAIVAAHPYEVPEVIVLPVVAGHTPYLDWVRAEASG